jgi:hypothetical protein
MGVVEVVGDTPPDPVELDPEDDLVAVGQGLAFAERSGRCSPSDGRLK